MRGARAVSGGVWTRVGLSGLEERGGLEWPDTRPYVRNGSTSSTLHTTYATKRLSGSYLVGLCDDMY